MRIVYSAALRVGVGLRGVLFDVLRVPGWMRLHQPRRTGSAANACGILAKGFVALPQPFIRAAARLAHDLGLMRIAEPFGDGLALAAVEAGIGHRLNAATQRG